MKQLRTVIFVGLIGMMALGADASTDLSSIREAVKRSVESLRSGYGYFVAAHVPGNYFKQTLILKGNMVVARSFWAFGGDKWRFDRATVYPEDKATGAVIRVAWDGMNAIAQSRSRNYSIRGMDHARMEAMFDMIAPLTTAEDKKALDDPSAEYVGDELVDGENTHHVIAKTGSFIYDLWISPSHGYQIKRMRRIPNPGAGLSTDYRVLSFKQYDGVWMPECAIELRYYQPDKEYKDLDIRRFQIVEFHANASIADSEFKLGGDAEKSSAAFPPDEIINLIQPIKQDEIQMLFSSVKINEP